MNNDLNNNLNISAEQYVVIFVGSFLVTKNDIERSRVEVPRITFQEYES